MSLPAAWIDRIFDKLSLTYGRDFMGRYEGLDINAVKSDWGHELAGFFTHPSAIAHALANLPERAPSVIEFRRIARSAPEPKVHQIEHCPAGKERIAAEIAKVNLQEVDRKVKDFRAWAKAIIARYEAGDSITKTQLSMARGALGEFV